MKTPAEIKALLIDAAGNPERVMREMSATAVLDCCEWLWAECAHLRGEVARREAFKAYVHRRLDEAGVPADPEPERNATHGCRIEGRLNYALDRWS